LRHAVDRFFLAVVVAVVPARVKSDRRDPHIQQADHIRMDVEARADVVSMLIYWNSKQLPNIGWTCSSFEKGVHDVGAGG
jgi:hypothetical protein